MKNLLYFILPILLWSCTKDGGNVYLEGRVYNPISGEGIEGVQIHLVKEKPFSGDIAGGGSTKRVKSVTSGADGSFKLVHLTNLLADYYYLVEHDSDKYKMIGWENGGSEIKEVVQKEEVYDNLRLVPYGRYNIHVKNINCQGPSDSLHFELTYLLENENYNNIFYWEGCYETEGVSTLRAIGDYRWDWFVIRNGVRTDSSKVFTIHENDTTDVEMFY